MNNAVIEHDPQLPAPVARRGISEAAWRTAMNSLFPGAKPESVLMVFDYCTARKLDPLKKPCHIVPMQVRINGEYVWRDVVMPGIYEYRTTATRTGHYLGHSEPVYGEVKEFFGRKVPESCSMTVYRWNPLAKQRGEYPVTVWFEECCATKREAGGKEVLNARWHRAPRQMLTKCTESAGLREGYPDELGGTTTAEEMEGQLHIEATDVTPVTTGAAKGRPGPRPDLSDVDWETRDKHVSSIADLINLDKSENEIAVLLRDYHDTYLQPFPELFIAVFDKLAADNIISKKALREWMAMGQERDH